MVKDAVPLGSYDSVDQIVLEVSVADSGAVWNLCQASLGESQRFGTGSTIISRQQFYL